MNLDWLIPDLSGWVLSMLEVIWGGAGNLDTAQFGRSIETYSADAYSTVQSIQRSVVVPVSAVVISIMATLELARQSTRIDGDRKLGIQVVAATMFKLVLLVLIAQNAGLILGAINDIFQTIMDGFVAEHPQSTNTPVVPEKVRTAVEDAGFFEQLVMGMNLSLPLLIAQLAGIILRIVFWVRFMEIYLLSAFVTLPIAFLANPETKSIGVGYLRRYAAAGLQGAVLVLITILYASVGPKLMAGIGSSGMEAVSADGIASVGALVWFAANSLNLTLAPLGFIVLVAMSGRISRALVGEG